MSAPRSKRYAASVRSPSAREVRRVVAGSNHALSSSTRRVASVTSVLAPPMTPARPIARSGSAITHMESSSSRSWPSSVRKRSPRPAPPHDDRGLAHGDVVEGVQRVAQLPQHVVGDVHDVADRPEPDGAQARGHPRRRRAHPHVVDDPNGIARAQVGRLDPDVRDLRHRVARFLHRGLGNAEGRAGERRQLARHADHREAVGPIGGDLDLQHAVVETELRDEVRAERGVGSQGEDAALVLVADAELPLRDEHPLRLDVADLGRADAPCPAGRGVGQRGPGRRERRPHPDRRIGRPADHGEPLAPRAHPTQHEPMPVAVAELPLDRLDLPDDDARRAPPAPPASRSPPRSPR